LIQEHAVVMFRCFSEYCHKSCEMFYT